MEWQYALAEGESLSPVIGADILSLKKLALISRSPKKFKFIMYALKQYAEEAPDEQSPYKAFVKRVDDSPYTRRDWMEALYFLSSWLARNQRNEKISMRLGYLSCCAESVVDKQYQLPFTDLVKDMLDEYGFEGNPCARS